MSMRNDSGKLIFTDLDGSLLDHFDYSFAAASPLLHRLESLGIPVIFCTSKTFAELLSIREQIGNSHPFVVENGAAVFVPAGYFATSPGQGYLGASEDRDFTCYSFSRPRSLWQSLLDRLADEYTFISFSQMGALQIADETDLSLRNAELANTRKFSEPVKWLGGEDDKQRFAEALREMGAGVLEGGRFLQVSDHCNKGQALRWLLGVYEKETKQSMTTIAVGDSNNDVAMLEAADHALVIRSPVHSAPELLRKENVMFSSQYGPQGWVEGIEAILELK